MFHLLEDRHVSFSDKSGIDTSLSGRMRSYFTSMFLSSTEKHMHPFGGHYETTTVEWNFRRNILSNALSTKIGLFFEKFLTINPYIKL